MEREIKFKGTKGEWRMMVGGFSKKENTANVIQIYAANDDLEMICKVHKDRILHKKDQDFEANAKLISQAPRLLQTLQTIKQILESPKLIDAGNLRRLVNHAIEEAV